MADQGGTGNPTNSVASNALYAPPFSVRLLAYENEHNNASRQDSDQLLALLPAFYRKESGDPGTAGLHVTARVERELDLHWLANIQGWLWIAGLSLPPRVLHHQLLLGREVVTEQMDMHLVWTAGRMFLKPIPRFLLEPGCWAVYLSDFRIAKDEYLLPPEVRWPAWRILVEQLDMERIYPSVDRRFIHGELRLSHLNKIYALYKTPLRRYMARWDQYGSFFHDYFAWSASATVYIVLTAMQVELATESLAHSHAF
ncbi:hypothetical protein BBAD15_g12091 [Beauveria bassiana D1-5]|uniref:Uncharacterized protein n=1 Tax=Beauveria bassiana D1-5 TaxID=1245745 RepID=A0A0A2V5H0_BEABA|nr:hypothetical protein BBAD15_g12091 [Beauveria bassiana D1-5]